MSAITTHVLDTALGRPADGVPVGSPPWAMKPGRTFQSRKEE